MTDFDVDDAGCESVILLASREAPPIVSGVADYLAALDGALRRLGYCTQLVVPPAAVRSCRLTSLAWVQAELLCRVVARGLRRRPTAVVALTWKGEGVVAAALSRAGLCSVGIVAHGTELQQFSRGGLIDHLRKWSLESADLVLPNSRFTRTLVLGRAPAAAVPVVLFPIVEDPGRQLPLELASDDFVVFTASRWVKRKGHEVLIEAIRRLRADGVPITLRCTGRPHEGGPYADMVESGGLTFLGWIDDQELAREFASCDLYCSPSSVDSVDVEGFGISFARAGLAAKPVLAGRVGGVAEVVDHGSTGVLLRDVSVDSVTNSLRAFVDNRAMCVRMGAAGRQRVEDLFTAKAQQERLSLVAERLLR